MQLPRVVQHWLFFLWKVFDKLLDKYSKSDEERFLISIAGCSRSGKTTLANRIKTDLGKKRIYSKIIPLDNWLLGVDERNGNETVRQRYRYKKISEDINRLKKGEKVYTRIYDHKTRKIIINKSLRVILIYYS